MLHNYFWRWIHELWTVNDLKGLKKLAKRTLNALFCELWENIVRNNRYDTTKQHPRILYVDSTGNDWHGIWDGIFSLPMLQSLWNIADLDVLTTSVRRVVFNNQEHIKNVFTARNEPWRDYDYILLLHRSFRKFQFIAQRYGIQWLFNSTLLSTYTKRFVQDIHTNQIEMAHAWVTDVIPVLSPLDNCIPHIQLGENTRKFGRNYVEKYWSEKNITIAVGNKDPRREYKKLHETINLLAKAYTWYTFFLMWDESGLLQENFIDSNLPNVVRCSSRFTLEESFGIIHACDGAIWLDSGLANAAIALGINTYVVYNIVYPEERIPRDANHVTSIDVGCNDKCYYRKDAHICHKTWTPTPHCLDNYPSLALFNDIAQRIDAKFTH